MAFMTINGAPVSVSSVDEFYTPISQSQRAFDGTLRKTMKTMKRSWKVKTTLMAGNDAEILERILYAIGDGLSFDDHYFSSKGVKPTTYLNSVFRRGLGADGLPVFGQGKFRTSGLSCAAATNNRLTANQSNVETNTTGFTAVDGATIARDTTYFYEGVASLSVITSAAVNAVRGGVFTDNATAGSATATVGSAYIMSATAVSVRLYVRNETTATDGTPTTVTLTPYTWQRVEAVAPAHAGGDNLRIFVLEETADSNITFYCDNFQLEVNSGSYARPWVTGGTTSTASSVPKWATAFMTGMDEMTVSCWVGKINEVNAPAYVLASAADSAMITIWRASATTANVQVWNGGSAATVATPTSLWTGGVQNMLTVIVRQTRTPNYEVYKDGTLFASGNTTVAVSGATNLQIANGFGGGSYCDGTIDDVVVLPFAVDAATVSGWYNLGKPLSIYPRLWLGGDLIPGGPVMVQVINDQSAYTPSMQTSWDNTAREVAFTLEEI